MVRVRPSHRGGCLVGFHTARAAFRYERVTGRCEWTGSVDDVAARAGARPRGRATPATL